MFNEICINEEMLPKWTYLNFCIVASEDFLKKCTQILDIKYSCLIQISVLYEEIISIQLLFIWTNLFGFVYSYLTRIIRKQLYRFKQIIIVISTELL